MKKKYLNLPNVLTMLRIVLVPVCMALILYTPETLGSRLVAAGVFLLISFTDLLDGHIARKYHMVTDFGKFLDPVADKVLILGAFTAILAVTADTLFGRLLVWVIFLILLREFSVTSLRLLLAGREGKVVSASLFGKVKTVSQMVAVCVFLLEPTLLSPFLGTPDRLFSYLFLAVVSVTTLGSGIQYFIVNLRK
ncbi:MAG: CDP-diacylglycerol--glycerol-3-phosphate 3-phosphatidyltransferase [Clostridia bacterium]|nr:CDP-diacylglycerol--glycerol-3-phosphate 3-phosphatidyltransferase [Clostridia bacterium]